MYVCVHECKCPQAGRQSRSPEAGLEEGCKMWVLGPDHGPLQEPCMLKTVKPPLSPASKYFSTIKTFQKQSTMKDGKDFGPMELVLPDS